MHCRHALSLTLAWRAPYPAHYSPRRCLSLYSPSLAPPPPAPLVSLPPFPFPWQFGCPHPAPRLALPVQASGGPALPSSLSQRYEKIVEGLQAQGARPGAHASAVIFYSTQAATLVLELLPQGGQPSSSAAAHAAALFQCVQWAYRHTLLQLRQELEREAAAAASQPAAAAALPPQPSSRPWDAPASAAEQWVKLTAQYAVFLARCGPGLLGRPGASQELWTLLDPMLASGVAPSQPTINALLDAALASEDCLGIARLVPALPQLGIVDTEFLSHKVRSVLIECLERRCTRARGGEAVGEDTGALLQAVAAALNPTAAAAAGGSEDALNAAFAQVADFLLHPPPLAAYKGSSSLSSEDREGGNSSISSSGSGSSMGSELDKAFVLAGVLQKRARLAQRLCLAFPAAGSSRKTLQAAWRAELQLAALKFSRTAGCTPLGSAQGEEEFASVEAMLTLVTGVLEGERSGSGSSWLKACSSAHRELMGSLAAGQPGLPREAALAGPSAAVSLLGEAVLTYLLLPKISAAVGGEGGSDYARARELSELCFSLTQQVWEVRGGGGYPLSPDMAKGLFTAMLSAGNPRGAGDLLKILGGESSTAAGTPDSLHASFSSSDSDSTALAQQLFDSAVEACCGDRSASSSCEAADAHRGTTVSTLLLVLPDLVAAGVRVHPEALGRVFALGVQQWAATLQTSCPACVQGSSSSGSTSTSSTPQAAVQPLTRTIKSAVESQWNEVTRSLVASPAGQPSPAAVPAVPQQQLASAPSSQPTRRRPSRRERDADWVVAAAAAPPPAAASDDSEQHSAWHAPTTPTFQASRTPLSGCATLWNIGSSAAPPPLTSLVPWALPPSRQIELLAATGLLDDTPPAALLAALQVACTAGCGRESWALWRELCYRGQGQQLLQRVSGEGAGSSQAERALLLRVLRVFARGGLQLPAWDMYMALKGRGHSAGPLPPLSELAQWAAEEGERVRGRQQLEEEEEGGQRQQQMGQQQQQQQHLSSEESTAEAILRGVQQALGSELQLPERSSAGVVQQQQPQPQSQTLSQQQQQQQQQQHSPQQQPLPCVWVKKLAADATEESLRKEFAGFPVTSVFIKRTKAGNNAYVFLPQPSDVARAVEHFAGSPRLLVAHPLRPMKPKPHGWVER